MLDHDFMCPRCGRGVTHSQDPVDGVDGPAKVKTTVPYRCRCGAAFTLDVDWLPYFSVVPGSLTPPPRDASRGEMTDASATHAQKNCQSCLHNDAVGYPCSRCDDARGHWEPVSPEDKADPEWVGVDDGAEDMAACAEPAASPVTAWRSWVAEMSGRKDCSTCRYGDGPIQVDPCRDCFPTAPESAAGWVGPAWEPRTKDAQV